MKDNRNPNTYIRAQWCIDSETSETCLIDLDTNEIIMKLPYNTTSIEENKSSNTEVKCPKCGKI